MHCAVTTMNPRVASIEGGYTSWSPVCLCPRKGPGRTRPLFTMGSNIQPGHRRTETHSLLLPYPDLTPSRKTPPFLPPNVPESSHGSNLVFLARRVQVVPPTPRPTPLCLVSTFPLSSILPIFLSSETPQLCLTGSSLSPLSQPRFSLCLHLLTPHRLPSSGVEVTSDLMPDTLGTLFSVFASLTSLYVLLGEVCVAEHMGSGNRQLSFTSCVALVFFLSLSFSLSPSFSFSPFFFSVFLFPSVFPSFFFFDFLITFFLSNLYLNST